MLLGDLRTGVDAILDAPDQVGQKEILLDHLTKGRIIQVPKATNTSGLKSYIKIDVTV